MARKPPPSLPDVFAKPGAAPSRGTPIEDLPQVVEERRPPPPLVVEEAPAAPQVAEKLPSPPPEPPRVVVEPPPPPTVEPPLPHPPLPAPRPAAADEFYRPPPPPAQPSWRGRSLAILALAVALTTPFWEDALLATFGIRTPSRQAAEQSTIAVLRQDRRTEDIAQRLTAAMAQMTKQQAEFTAAMQRAEVSANLIRTMSLVRLSDTLRRPVPFAAELAVVQATGTDLGDLKPLLNRIEPYAATGIPGSTQLRQEFRTLFDQVSAGERGAGSSWLGNLAVWVRLRTAAPTAVAPDPSLEFLQSASARLADVDMAGAVEQTRRIGDDYKPIFAAWLEDAEARVAADTLAEKVSDLVTKALRAPKGR